MTLESTVPRGLVRGLFHATVLTSDRAEWCDWFERVFGRRSMMQTDFSPKETRQQDSSYPSDYYAFTRVGETWVEIIDPRNYTAGAIGDAREPSLDRMVEFGLQVHDIDDALAACASARVRTFDMTGSRIVSREEMSQVVAPSISFLWTDADDSGLSIELAWLAPGRTRVIDDFVYREPPEDDPLGIVRCAYHTVMTGDIGRSLRIIEALGARVVLQTPYVEGKSRSTYVALDDELAGTQLTIKYVEPDPGSIEFDLLRRDRRTSVLGQVQSDVYDAMTFVVHDLDAVGRHLSASGIRYEARDDGTLEAHRDDCLGIPWSFRSEYPAGDPRRPQSFPAAYEPRARDEE
jgi:hypothetical protein